MFISEYFKIAIFIAAILINNGVRRFAISIRILRTKLLKKTFV